MAMTATDFKVKQSLAKATKSVRDKFRQLRSMQLEQNRLLEEQYMPITKKLSALIASKKEKKSSATATAAAATIGRKKVVGRTFPFAHSTPSKSAAAKKRRSLDDYFSDTWHHSPRTEKIQSRVTGHSFFEHSLSDFNASVAPICESVGPSVLSIQTDRSDPTPICETVDTSSPPIDQSREYTHGCHIDTILVYVPEEKQLYRKHFETSYRCYATDCGARTYLKSETVCTRNNVSHNHADKESVYKKFAFKHSVKTKVIENKTANMRKIFEEQVVW